MIPLFKPKRPSAILGLSIDGNRLDAVVVKRNNGTLTVQQSVSVPLALSPLSGDPQLVGREIRNHLNEAGIRERRCAVCLPLNWVLTVQTKLPDLPEADVANYLEIEAERGFPSGHENLYIANSRAHATNEDQYATLMGIPRNHLAILEEALKAAQLKPVTFSLGITALAAGGGDSKAGVIALGLAPHGIDLQVTAGGGIAALRSLDGATETETATKRIDADLVARELRITLGQLPPAFAREAGKIKVFGRGEMARQFVSDIAPRADSMGLRVELMDSATEAQFTQMPAPEIALSPALALAANYLRAVSGSPEFLPPKVHPWKLFLATKVSSRKLAWVGGAVGAAAACVAGLFLYQQIQISQLDTKWKRMEPKVGTNGSLTLAQQNIVQFRPWYDHSFRALRIMRELTQAFPEEGYVSAKNLEIRDDLTTVTCSGAANNNQSYLALVEKLRQQPDVAELNTESTHGNSPMQFTFNFQWQEGGSTNAN